MTSETVAMAAKSAPVLPETIVTNGGEDIVSEDVTKATTDNTAVTVQEVSSTAATLNSVAMETTPSEIKQSEDDHGNLSIIDTLL